MNSTNCRDAAPCPFLTADLPAPGELTPAFSQLYERYVKALALLCECAAYVDEPDYLDLLDEVLDEACAHYPLRWRNDGCHRQIALTEEAR